MQHAKDSFYVALRDRLAALNPARTVFLDGVLRPAVIVAENEPSTPSLPLPDAFYLQWGSVREVKSSQRVPRPLLAFDCQIIYRTIGTEASSSVDRGRVLAALDLELLQICNPPETTKRDYTQTTPLDLGTKVFWTRPQIVETVALGTELRRTAKATVYFYPEVDLG
ncbi:MAG: hypothetical protein L0212_07945 [Acidobacteria bacterium]|nr:hypothetical protein [Acidobacteriota bacterium]